MLLKLIVDVAVRSFIVYDIYRTGCEDHYENNENYEREDLVYYWLFGSSMVAFYLLIIANINLWVSYVIKIKKAAAKIKGSQYDEADNHQRNIDIGTVLATIASVAVYFYFTGNIASASYKEDSSGDHEHEEREKHFEGWFGCMGSIFIILSIAFTTVGVCILLELKKSFSSFYEMYGCYIRLAIAFLVLPIFGRGIFNLCLISKDIRESLGIQKSGTEDEI